jgi:2-polyprenyl-3-methyl-5-hydroxy-6-metoxy-1,4-benzoquinol methylase
MYNRTACAICNSSEFVPFLTCEDHSVSHEVFNIVSCARCGFKFTNPSPEPEHIGKYYQSEEYISHSDTRKGLIARMYHIVRDYTLAGKLSLIKKYVPRGTILDFGCGTGMFLRKCLGDGWIGTGVEPDSGAAKIASSSGAVIHSSLSQVQVPKKFDVITLWHVLEHVSDLKGTMEWFKEHLAATGVLIVAVPNHLSLDAEHYHKFWAAYDVPRHLHHFSPDTIKLLGEKSGFKMMLQIPMKFDSFYVSMLSEKYMNGRVRYPQAFLNGIKSNLKAARTGNYSSLIYVFTHNKSVD